MPVVGVGECRWYSVQARYRSADEGKALVVDTNGQVFEQIEKEKRIKESILDRLVGGSISGKSLRE